ncbi:MAG: DUF2062 domain-containing protein [Phycisphaera sp.]|nr:DUF2062 domain-containing protein [Phycisphaera sp.]
MLTRKLGKILRGKATPAQLMMACVLGATLGFMPGFTQAGGLIVFLILLLIILNANLGVAAIIGGLSKLASLALMPVSFYIGRGLLDGPTQGLFKAMINAPVLALFGFEYYATTGGLVLGLVVGLVTGFMVISSIKSFRRRMADLEENSETYKKYMSKGSTKWLLWIFFGGGAKQSFGELMELKGKVIRPIGVVFAVLVVVALVLVQQFFSGPIVTSVLKRELAAANGATVDLESADANLKEGRLVMNGLAMADPNALDTNLLEAERVEIDISGTDLLRKRMTLDKVTVVSGRNGTKRAVPGVIVGAGPQPTPEEKTDKQPGEKTIDEYIKQAKEWKERLAQLRKWLDEMSGDQSPTEGGKPEETLAERLAREIREKGYANVTASHLIEGSPSVTVTQLIADKVQTDKLDGETLDIHGENLSTQPRLLDGAPKLTIKSSKGTLNFDVNMAGVSKAGGDSTLAMSYAGLPVDTFSGQLPAVGGAAPISGGTLDASLNGKLMTANGASINMPLKITLHNTTVTLPAAGSAPVDQLAIPLKLRGPIDNPRITLSDDTLATALKDAGAAVLAGKLKGEAGKQIDKATGQLQDKLGDKVGGEVGDKLGGAVKGLFGGDKKK